MPLNTADQNPNTFNVVPAKTDKNGSDRGQCSWFERPMTSNVVGDRLQIVDVNMQTFVWNGADWFNPMFATDPLTGAVKGLVVPDGSVAAIVASAASRYAALQIRPVGFNYYSLISEQLYSIANVATNRPVQLAWIKSTGANVVRVAYPCFGAAQYLTQVHNTASMPTEVSDGNLRTSFITAVDTAMDALATYGIKALMCLMWSQNDLPTAMGETNIVGYGSTASKTSVYAASMVRWFTRRYANHAALGIVSFGNEYVTDATGTTNPTPAQLGAWFTYLSNAAKSGRKDVLTTADISSPTTDITNTRESLDAAIVRYRTLYAGLDLYCLHLYADGYNFVGRQSNENGTTPNAPYNTFGYEGVPSLCETLGAMAKADQKPIILGEWGVPTTNEEDNPSGGYAAFLSDKKKWKFARQIVPFVDSALIWNVMDSTQASTSGNQNLWCIDPAAATQRAPQFLAIATAFNAAKPDAPRVAGGARALKEQLRPTISIKSPNRGAGVNLRATSTAAHQSSKGYTLCFWVNLSAQLNSGEAIIDLRGVGATSGIMALGALSANTQQIYSDGRYASGSSGNNVSTLPDFTLGEWYHVAISMVAISDNGTPRNTVTTWLNGVYYKTLTVTSIPAAIPIGTTLYLLGNSSNGVPVKVQDVALFDVVTPQEIWDHMRGVISPRSLIHVRGYEDGSILDVSKNAVTLTATSVTAVVE